MPTHWAGRRSRGSPAVFTHVPHLDAENGIQKKAPRASAVTCPARMNRILIKSELPMRLWKGMCAPQSDSHFGFFKNIDFLCLGARPSADLTHQYSTNWKEAQQSYFTHMSLQQLAVIGSVSSPFCLKLAACCRYHGCFSILCSFSVTGGTLKTMLFGQRFLLNGPSFIFTYGAFLVPEQLYTWLHLERNE